MLRRIYDGRVSNCVQLFENWDFLAGIVEDSKGRGFRSLMRVGRPGTLTGSRFTHINFPHAEAGNILCLGLPHSVMV